MDLQELIDDYLDGKLNPKDRKLFEDLIAENPQYKAELMAQTHGRAAVESVEKRSTQSGLISWSISAAIAVLLVAVGYFLWTTLGMSPGEKLYAKHYETPSRQDLGSAPSREEPKLTSEAFLAYDQGNFKKAAALFEQVEAGPDLDYILFYSGICQLELGRPEKAIPLFDRIHSDSKSVSKEIASWYEALGYFKLDMIDKGKAALQLTASNPNPFTDAAKDILETLK